MAKSINFATNICETMGKKNIYDNNKEDAVFFANSVFEHKEDKSVLLKVHEEAIKKYMLTGIFKLSHLYLSDNDKNVSVKRHSHDYYQILWFRKGNGWYMENNERFELSDNYLLFVSPAVIHEFLFKGENDIINISFTEPFYENFCPMVEVFVKYDIFERSFRYANVISRNGLNVRLQHLVEAMQKEYINEKYQISKMPRIGALLSLFLLDVKRSFLDEEVIKLPTYAYTKVLEFRRILEKNVCKTHYVKDYAVMLGISSSSLYRYVTDIVGVSPLELIHMELVAHAKRLMTISRLSYKELSEQLGFSDIANFSKIFRKVTGITISEFYENHN